MTCTLERENNSEFGFDPFQLQRVNNYEIVQNAGVKGTETGGPISSVVPSLSLCTRVYGELNNFVIVNSVGQLTRRFVTEAISFH
jgi:hypothetical protein